MRHKELMTRALAASLATMQVGTLVAQAPMSVYAAELNMEEETAEESTEPEEPVEEEEVAESEETIKESDEAEEPESEESSEVEKSESDETDESEELDSEESSEADDSESAESSEVDEPEPEESSEAEEPESEETDEVEELESEESSEADEPEETDEVDEAGELESEESGEANEPESEDSGETDDSELEETDEAEELEPEESSEFEETDKLESEETDEANESEETSEAEESESEDGILEDNLAAPVEGGTPTKAPAKAPAKAPEEVKTYKITVMDILVDEDGNELGSETRFIDELEEGEEYTYNALNDEGLTVIGKSEYMGICESDLTIKFKYTSEDLGVNLFAAGFIVTADGKTYTTDENGYITEPDDPEPREGYIFAGWSLTENEQYEWNKIDFTSRVFLSDTEIYPIWLQAEFTVTFDTLGGSDVEEQSVARGEFAQKTVMPVKEGFLFNGWTKNREEAEAGGYHGNSTTDLYNVSIYEDTTFYAIWCPAYTITVTDHYYDYKGNEITTIQRDIVTLSVGSAIQSLGSEECHEGINRYSGSSLGAVLRKSYNGYGIDPYSSVSAHLDGDYDTSKLCVDDPKDIDKFYLFQKCIVTYDDTTITPKELVGEEINGAFNFSPDGKTGNCSFDFYYIESSVHNMPVTRHYGIFDENDEYVELYTNQAIMHKDNSNILDIGNESSERSLTISCCRSFDKDIVKAHYEGISVDSPGLFRDTVSPLSYYIVDSNALTPFSADIDLWGVDESDYPSFEFPIFNDAKLDVYKIASIRVYLNSSNGGSIATDCYGHISTPDDPAARDGYVFKGWSRTEGDTSESNKIDFDIEVFTENTNIYPIWVDSSAVDTYTVTIKDKYYDTDGVTLLEEKTRSVETYNAGDNVTVYSQYNDFYSCAETSKTVTDIQEDTEIEFVYVKKLAYTVDITYVYYEADGVTEIKRETDQQIVLAGNRCWLDKYNWAYYHTLEETSFIPDKNMEVEVAYYKYSTATAIIHVKDSEGNEIDEVRQEIYSLKNGLQTVYVEAPKYTSPSTCQKEVEVSDGMEISFDVTATPTQVTVYDYFGTIATYEMYYGDWQEYVRILERGIEDKANGDILDGGPYCFFPTEGSSTHTVEMNYGDSEDKLLGSYEGWRIVPQYKASNGYSNRISVTSVFDTGWGYSEWVMGYYDYDATRSPLYNNCYYVRSNDIIVTADGKTYTVDSDGKITTPDAPADKVGYEFKGWSRTEGDTNPNNKIDFSKEVFDTDTEIYPIWVVIVAAVKVTADGKTYIADNDGHIRTPDVPAAREGYIFKGWSRTEGDTNPSNKIDFANEVFDTDTEIYPIWVKAAVVTADGKPYTVDEKGHIKTPDYPDDNPGYVFGGWSRTEGDTNPDNKLDFTSEVFETDTKIYPIWVDADSVVKVTADGRFYAADSKGHIPTPVDPTSKAGYIFGGWSFSEGDEDTGNKIDFVTQVFESDTEVYPIWVKEYTVNAGGKEYKTDIDGHIPTPDKPDNKPGYTFKGWSRTPDDTDPDNKIDFTSEVFIEDTEIYPIWVKAVMVTADGKDYMVDDDGHIRIPDDPAAKEGYIFGGWSRTEGDTDPDNRLDFTSEVFDKDTEVYPIWVEQFTVTADGKPYKTDIDGHISTPDKPEDKPGYIFRGWSRTEGDTNPGNKLDFSKEVFTSDGEIYPIWVEKASVVTVTADGKTYIADSDGHISTPSVPAARPGYIFKGWSYIEGDTDPDNKIDFSSEVFTSDTEVYPIWIKEVPGSSSGNGSGSNPGSSSSGSNSGSSSNSSSGERSSSSRIGSYQELSGSWVYLEDGRWRFKLTDGSEIIGKWAYLKNPYAVTSLGQNEVDWFRFDDEGYMVTGWWTDVDGNIYYLHPISDGSQGHMYTGWHWLEGTDGLLRCYYFNTESDGTRGALYRSKTTPDGSVVDESGAWVVGNGAVTREAVKTAEEVLTVAKDSTFKGILRSISRMFNL